MKKMLETIVQQQTIVSIFFDRGNPDSPVVGRVISFDGGNILMSVFSPSGVWDGYLVRKLADLFRIEQGGLYERKIALLAESRGQAESEHSIQVNPAENVQSQLFRLAKTEERIIGVGQVETDVLLYGFVNEVLEKTLSLALLNDYGINDGSSIVLLDDVDFFELSSIECRSLKILNKTTE